MIAVVSVTSCVRNVCTRIQVLQNVAELGEGSAASMPKATGLDVPLNGPKQEKWWYEVSAGPLSVSLSLCLSV